MTQISAERLEELLSANESAARGNDWLHRDTEDYVDTAAAMRELQQLRKAVSDHNSNLGPQVCQGWIECLPAS